MKVVNPATGETLRELTEDAALVVAGKVARARAAQPGWAARPLGERLAALARFRQLLVDDCAVLARVLTAEVGKPITQTRNYVRRVVGNWARYAYLADPARGWPFEVPTHLPSSARRR